MTQPARTTTRILISASSFADAAAALRLLRRLRPEAQFTIGGLFVEESTIMALCQLPNQRIVSSSGALVIAPSVSQLRMVLEADAKAFRTSLEQWSTSIAAQWSFERTMGDLVQNALKASAGWDVIVFGHKSIHSVDGQIVLLERSDTKDQTLLRFADTLADALSVKRVVFSVGVGSESTQGRRGFDTLEEAITALARTNAEGVLVDLARGPVHNPEQVRELLELARCPVFAFGAAMSGKTLEHSTQIPPVLDTRDAEAQS